MDANIIPEFAIGFRKNVSKSFPILRYARKSFLGVSQWIRLRYFCSHVLSCQRFRPFFSKPIAKSGITHKKGQILGALVIFIVLIVLFGGIMKIWFWANAQIVHRQREYNAGRVAAGTSQQDYKIVWPMARTEELK